MSWWEDKCAETRAKVEAGPWQDEPDRLEWRHKGVPCLIVRNPTGFNLCGYAAVNPGHPWHGKSYGGEDGIDAIAHGGLTFADKCMPNGPVCHVAQPGEPEDVWWLGFDCAHYMDRMPGYDALSQEMHFKLGSPKRAMSFLDHASYKTVEYVKAECERLAEQILEADTREEIRPAVG